MATKTNGLSASALAFALGSLGGSGGGGGTPGKPGQDGTRWFVVNETLTDGGKPPIGAKRGDLVLDKDGKIYEIKESNGELVLSNTGVGLGSGSGIQKTLYELYKEIADKDAVTEEEFNKKFINLIASSGQIGATDRIVSADGKSEVVASETGIIMNSTADEINGAVEIHNLKNPVADLDAVNLRYLKEYVDNRLKQFYDWLNGMYVVYGGTATTKYTDTIHGGDSDGMLDQIINGGDADDQLNNTVNGGKSNTMDSEYIANLDGNNVEPTDIVVLNGGASNGGYSSEEDIPPEMLPDVAKENEIQLKKETSEDENVNKAENRVDKKEEVTLDEAMKEDKVMTINLFGGGANG